MENFPKGCNPSWVQCVLCLKTTNLDQEEASTVSYPAGVSRNVVPRVFALLGRSFQG